MRTECVFIDSLIRSFMIFQTYSVRPPKRVLLLQVKLSKRFYYTHKKTDNIEVCLRCTIYAIRIVTEFHENNKKNITININIYSQDHSTLYLKWTADGGLPFKLLSMA